MCMTFGRKWTSVGLLERLQNIGGPVDCFLWPARSFVFATFNFIVDNKRQRRQTTQRSHPGIHHQLFIRLWLMVFVFAHPHLSTAIIVVAIILLIMFAIIPIQQRSSLKFIVARPPARPFISPKGRTLPRQGMETCKPGVAPPVYCRMNAPSYRLEAHLGHTCSTHLVLPFLQPCLI